MDQYIAVLIQSGRVVLPGGDGDVLHKLREQLVRAGVDQFTQATINIGQGHERMVGEMSEPARRGGPIHRGGPGSQDVNQRAAARG